MRGRRVGRKLALPLAGTDAKKSKKMQDEREAKKKVAQRKLYRDFALNVGVVMLWFFIIASVFFPNWSTVWF